MHNVLTELRVILQSLPRMSPVMDQKMDGYQLILLQRQAYMNQVWVIWILPEDIDMRYGMQVSPDMFMMI